MPRVQPSARTRWVFTLNNPGSSDVPRLWSGLTSWLFWQRELSESGTPHLQGALILKKKARLSILKLLCPTAHWEPMAGTPGQSKTYCSKLETRTAGPWEIGICPSANGQNPLLRLKALVDTGVADAVLWDTEFVLMSKHWRAVSRYRLAATQHRCARPTIIILWGASGTGKTKLVRECFPYAYWKPKNKWWDGYCNEEVVIFDEFYSWLPLDLLLRVLDWYPVQLETKGGSVQLTTSCFVFTSNQDPLEWYSKLPMYRRAALHRRFKEFGLVLPFFPGGPPCGPLPLQRLAEGR